MGEWPNKSSQFSSTNQPAKNGRPKKLPPLDEMMAKVLCEEKDGISAVQAIIMAMRAKAARGDTKAAQLLLDRGYGKAKEFIEHSGKMSTQVIQANIDISNYTYEQLLSLMTAQQTPLIESNDDTGTDTTGSV